MGDRIAQEVALGVGASGALVNVSEFADLDAGVEYSYGRESGFDDVDAGEWSFTLDNADGQFTPGNTTGAVAAGYSVPLAIGAAASWQLGSRIVSGQVVAVEPEFPGDEAAWAQVRVTCDDALGLASRVQLDELWYSQAVSDGLVFFPFDEVEGSAQAFDAIGQEAYWQYEETADRGGITFGVERPNALPGAPRSWCQLRSLAPTTPRTLEVSNSSPVAAGTEGTVNVWLETPYESFDLRWFFGGQDAFLSIGSSFVQVWAGSSGPVAFSARVNNTDGPHFYSIVNTYTASSITLTLYRDGVQLGSATKSGLTISNPSFEFNDMLVYNDGSTESSVFIAGLSFTPTRLNSIYATPSTSTDRALAIVRAVPVDIEFDGDLLFQRLGGADTAGQSVLDALNDLVRTEQGQLYTRTTGTLTSPVQTIVVRGRDRPITATESFDVEDDLAGAPELVLDISNKASSVTVNGPDGSVTVRA